MLGTLDFTGLEHRAPFNKLRAQLCEGLKQFHPPQDRAQKILTLHPKFDDPLNQ